MSDFIASARRLTIEAGVIAGRLYAFLDRACPVAGAASDGREFLRGAFEAAANGQTLDHCDDGPLSRRPTNRLQPLDRLTDALGLSRLETELCLLAGVPEEHEGFGAVFRALHPRGEAHPSIGLAVQLFSLGSDDRSTLRAVLESGAATASGALRMVGDGPFFERSLRLAEGLWAALAGFASWPALVPLIDATVISCGLEEWLATPVVARAVAAVARGVPCTVLVTGETMDSAFHRALALAAHAGGEPAGFALPPQPDRTLEQLIGVHALARGLTPVLRVPAPEGPNAVEVPQFPHYPRPVILCACSRGLQIHGTRPLIAVTADRLSAAAHRQMWRAVLPTLANEAAHLAARYPLEPAAAAAVAADLNALCEVEARPATMEDASASIRARAALTLVGGVRLIHPQARWDDLILPKDRLAQLKEACARLLLQDRVLDQWGFLAGRPGARGVRMLFAGPPGTGKTFSAEVLAHSLSVDLLYADISRVVSKWIGETEKNLASLFEAAERSQAALFFDEADALFGKRTEVADAHDRYANLETAYLLSRLERFEGLAILATNLRHNIDPAFMRRLEFVIDFDAPDHDERLNLWRAHVPRSAPLARDVDLNELAARYAVVGAFIRNAAAAAGFLAAGDGGIITRGHFIHAIRREYEKSGRAFPGNPAGFENYG
jgi:hypothetical protein